jgi:4-amino-4-deoxy-L-arabinose transferase-like glycosyltransferase
MTTWRERIRFGRAGWGLVALALLLRLAWAAVASTELRLDHVFTDATARGLAEGRGFTCSLEPPYDAAVFRTPGYSAFVALIYSLTGPAVRAVFFVQAVLDTLTCVAVGALARKRLGERAALFALALSATYPFLIHMVGRLSAETPMILLVTLFVIGLDDLPERAAWGRTAALGVLLGVIAWIKPVVLPLPALVLAAEWLRGRTLRTAFLRAALIGGVTVVLFAPWVLRNVEAHGRPLLAGELGIVVYHGTHDFSDDRDAMIAQGFADEDALAAAAGNAGDSAARYEAVRQLFARSEELLARDARFLEKGLERLRAEPLRGFLLDPLRRVPRLWVSTTYVGGPAWVGWGAAAGCIGYLLLAAAGLYHLRGSWRELAAWWTVPVLVTAVYAVLHVEARYSLPGRPEMLLLGAAALAAWLPGRAVSGSETSP